MGGLELLSQTKKRRLSSVPRLNIVFPDHHVAPFSVNFSISWLQYEQDALSVTVNTLKLVSDLSRTPATLVLPAAPHSLTSLRLLAGRDWEFICVLVADVLSSASSKSTPVSGQLLLMSRPLWPEDAETLCPSVPLHMRHVLVPLHLVSHFYLASACLMSCHVCRLTSSRSSSPLFMCGTFVLLPLFLFIPPHPLHSSCRHDGIQRHITVTPDLLPLLSARHLYDIML